MLLLPGLRSAKADLPCHILLCTGQSCSCVPLLQAQPSTTGKEAFAPGSFGLDPFSVPSVQDGEVQDLRAAYQNEVEGQVGHQATMVNVSCMSPDLLMTLWQLHEWSAKVLAQSISPQHLASPDCCKTSFHSLFAKTLPGSFLLYAFVASSLV
jgi:hypothetical protein